MKNIAVEACRIALQATPTSSDLSGARQAYGRYGAHRAYLVISGQTVAGQVDRSRKALNGAVKLLEQAGAKIVRAHGCGGDRAIYLGYDNFQGGIHAARGEAVCRELKNLGFTCYVDAAGD